MQRRTFLAVTASALATSSLAGCVGQSSTADSEQPPRETPPTTPTQKPSESTPTQSQSSNTETPVPFPESCQPVPDIDGLPTPPEEWTEDSVTSYVSEFERVYAVATERSYDDIDRLWVSGTETLGDRYRVTLAVEAKKPASTPGPDGNTPTPQPDDGFAHRALYRLEGDRMIREHLGFPASRTLSTDCWTLRSSSR